MHAIALKSSIFDFYSIQLVCRKWSGVRSKELDTEFETPPVPVLVFPLTLKLWVRDPDSLGLKFAVC